ncbi:MAG: MogA/MoaB family molybdenum cofactor biosynthesis protein [Armatimonadetes bacterium]|nr:MogA/MoaB family molybdenum cofactor biosynthesis protein [Armatimonadota bacterium]
MFNAGIITISDSAALGRRIDKSGPIIKRELESGNNFKVLAYTLIPDEKLIIKTTLIEMAENLNLDLIFTTGGTGLSRRDLTPEATKEVIDKEIPGIAMALLVNNLNKTPFSMLSRGIAGLRKQSLIINLPGNPKAVEESLEIILPVLFHALEIIKSESFQH